MPKREQPEKIKGVSYEVKGRAKKAGGSLTGDKVKKAEGARTGTRSPSRRRTS